MSIYDHPVQALDGSEADLHDYEGKVALVVNVASKCGLTPQYTGLEQVHERYADQGFSVVGVPCNQFLGQEPGTAEEIVAFCSSTYGVTFPLTEKIEVNGDDRHPLYEVLTVTADSEGHSGDIRWNFEKFLVGRDGEVLARFAPQVEPDDGAVIDVANRGFWRADPDVTARLDAGEPVDEALYYYRTSPVFTTDAAPHVWLTRTVFVGLAREEHGRVCIRFFSLA